MEQADSRGQQQDVWGWILKDSCEQTDMTAAVFGGQVHLGLHSDKFFLKRLRVHLPKLTFDMKDKHLCLCLFSNLEYVFKYRQIQTFDNIILIVPNNLIHSKNYDKELCEMFLKVLNLYIW